MTMPSMPPNISIGSTGTSNYPPGVTTPMPRPKKSGCGCCGCFFTLFVLFLVFLGGLTAAYFFLDWGPIIEKQLYSSYKSQIRPLILEKIGPGMNDKQKQQTMEMMDYVVDEYMKLPEDRKKPIRKEFQVLIYYQMTGGRVPDEKIPHLLQFKEQIERSLPKKFNLKGMPPSGNSIAPSPPPPVIEEIQPPIPAPPAKPASKPLFF